MTNHAKMVARMQKRSIDNAIAASAEAARRKTFADEFLAMTPEQQMAWIAECKVAMRGEGYEPPAEIESPRLAAMEAQRERQAADGHEHTVQDMTEFVDYRD